MGGDKKPLPVRAGASGDANEPSGEGRCARLVKCLGRSRLPTPRRQRRWLQSSLSWMSFSAARLLVQELG